MIDLANPQPEDLTALASALREVLSLVNGSAPAEHGVLTAHFRCLVTKNPCGTDTWLVGHPCDCASCQTYLRLLRVYEDHGIKTRPEMEGSADPFIATMEKLLGGVEDALHFPKKP